MTPLEIEKYWKVRKVLKKHDLSSEELEWNRVVAQALMEESKDLGLEKWYVLNRELYKECLRRLERC